MSYNIWHIMGMGEKVSEEIRNRRLAVCKECNYLTNQGKCHLCSCPVEKKTRFANQKCDAGLWPV